MSKEERRTPINAVLGALQERAKELACLYKVEEILADPDRDLAEVFQEVTCAIPSGWQYSSICAAKIVYDDTENVTQGFDENDWMHCAPITVQDNVVGGLCVSYTKSMPEADVGPFLNEEIRLIETIATRIGHYILHQRLRGMFDSMSEYQSQVERSGRPEWTVAIELLRKTDPALLDRIARKIMNSLLIRGVEEAKGLIHQYGEDLRAEQIAGETNQPQKRTPLKDLTKLFDDTFQIASSYMTEDEILKQIQRWIYEDKVSSAVAPLVDLHSSMHDISDAMHRYRHLGHDAVGLSSAADNGLRVALISRFFTEQLEYVRIAKRYVIPKDFHSLVERLIYPNGSYGKLGGKSAGLFLGDTVLKRRKEDVPDLGVIKTPKTWYLTTDALHEFVRFNKLEEVYEQKYKSIDEVRQEYPHIVQLFKNSYFPNAIMKGLSLALDDFGEVPVIIRSSSILEDRLGAAFSGKYKSLFLANQGDKQSRIEALTDAIAEVYASTFGPDPIEYRAERGLLDFNEQMGIMIQQVVGKRTGDYFFPAYAGVAFSNNEFRWSPRIKREDGLIRLVPGLGTRAVDRVSDDYPTLIAPGQPNLRVNVTVDEIVRYAPKKMDVLNLRNGCFETIEVSKLVDEFGDTLPAFRKIASVCKEGTIPRPLGFATEYEKRDIVVTFESLIEGTGFVKQVESILKELERAMETPVDIEFASDGDDFYLLQCRPQCSSKGAYAASIPPDVPNERIVFSANRYVSNGVVPDITHIVYIDPLRYAELSEHDDLVAVGKAVGRLNKLLPKRQFILIGPGRWGSRGDIKLGVRVTYSDINNTAMLIEVARRKGNYVPDLSFGTHFFQDLVEACIRYLPLYPDEKGGSFNESFFLDSSNILSQMLPEFEKIKDVLRVIDVPQTTSGRILKVLSNAEEDKALAFLDIPGKQAIATSKEEGELSVQTTDHWRWRMDMAKRIGLELDAKRFGVVNYYVFGSTKNATAGPGSDIDLLIHFRGSRKQREELLAWLEGWSIALDETNYLRTGYRRGGGLLDVHLIDDVDITRRSSYAIKIGAITDAARRLPFSNE